MTNTWMGHIAATCLTLVLLVGCGGGGSDAAGNSGGANGGSSGGASGGGGAVAAPTVFNLSGTISIASTAAVDSDTNDVSQLTSGYLPNDTPGTAQVITAPVLLVGSVNQPNTGPRGNNNDGGTLLGDQDDYFRVDLVAGQVVELEFASDPLDSDVDLYVVSTDGVVGGASIGVDTRFECVTITQTGSYFVNVYAFRAASIYNLRMGAPGTAATCAQRAVPNALQPGQLIAEARRGRAGAAAEAQAWVRTAGARVQAQGASKADMTAGEGPQRLALDSSAAIRQQALRALEAAQDPAPRRRAQATVPSASIPLKGSFGMPTEAEPEIIVTYKTAKRLSASGAFEYVEPDLLMKSTVLAAPFPPNDRQYSLQRWHYEQISLPAAMSRIVSLQLPTTQRRPVVAVIDDGVMLDHPNLLPQLLSPGRAFVSGQLFDADRDSGDLIAGLAYRPVFHGTHVAGTAAGSTFDGVSGAGVAPMARILPLRVFPTGGQAASADIIQAMRYAAGLSNRSGTVPAQRADVINLSLGGAGLCNAAFATAVSDVRAAGVVVVAASGNESRNEEGIRVGVSSPANCSGVIAVGALDARRSLAYYSNTGAALSVAAPGGDQRVSTTGTGAVDAVFSDLGAFDAFGTRLATFGPMQGTSMAAPHVAGVVALMRYVNPGLTTAQIDSLLATGALTDDLGAAGRDADTGFGLINARKAVDAAAGALSVPPPVLAPQLAAWPSSIDFGLLQTSATVEVSASGPSTETVTGLTASGEGAAAISVGPVTVGANGSRRYPVSINRAALGRDGSFYPVLSFALSSRRTLNVQLAIQRSGSAAAATRSDFGPVYVLLVDPDTDAVLHTVRATWGNGRYTWAFTGYAKPRVQILAGGDLDNDDYLCARGEPCGAYPVLAAGNDPLVVELTGNRSDLNFEVSPLAGISAAGALPGAEGTAMKVWPRKAGAASISWQKPPASVDEAR